MNTPFNSMRMVLCGVLTMTCAASHVMADETNMWDQQIPVLKPRNSYLSEVGPHSRTWTLLQDKANRETMEATNPQGVGQRHVEELETGMNYFNGAQWVPSVPEFELVGSSFLARRVQHKIDIAADNINVGNAVEITVPGGGVIQSTPVAIGLYDTVSGESLIIGQLTDAAGVLLNTNQIVFENAFTGVNADIVYTIEKGSFAQDVIITGRLNPETYGFSTNTTRIQIFTEVYNAVNPQQIRRPIQIEQDETRRTRMASPDLIDNSLTVGDLYFGAGKAYVGSATNISDNGTAVAKEWVIAGDRRFLVESLEYSGIRDQISALPEANPNTSSEGASLRKLRKPLREAYAAIPQKRQSRSDLHARKTAPQKMASARSGLVIDYQVTLTGSSASGRVFSSDVTYLISGTVYCNGTTTMEGGTCLKYTTSGSVVINSGSLACKSSTYSPIVFTAADDHSVGDKLTSNSIQTNGYANPALYFSYASNPGISNAIFRYCKKAIRSDLYNTGTSPLQLGNSQIIDCIQGISVVVASGSSGSGSSGCSMALTVNNTLFANSSAFPALVSVINVTGLGTGCSTSTSTLMAASVTTSAASCGLLTATFNHCTLYRAQALGAADASGVSLSFINSILAGATSLYTASSAVTVSGSYNGFYNYGTGQPFGSSSRTTTASPFVDADNLSYYLTETSDFKNAGTTNGLTGLLAGFKDRTTSIPGTLSSLNGSTAISPIVPRYTGGLPDMGYYYPALDYVASEVVIGPGTNVTVLQGTALGIESHTTGFRLANGASINSVGTPTQPVVFVPTGLVQSKQTSLSAPNTTIVFTSDYTGNGAVVPQMQFRFSNFYLGCNDYHFCSGQNKIDGSITNQSASSCMYLGLRDSVLHGGKIGLGVNDTSRYSGSAAGQIGLTNTLFERVYTMMAPSATFTQPVYAYNNLFYRGIVSLTPAASGWKIYDSLFDQVAFSQNGTQSIDWNYNVFSQATTVQLADAANSGWVTTATATPTLTGTSNATTTTLPTYTASTFGSYYFIATASFYTANLQNKGSCTAPTAGLYHYTEVSVQTKEQSTQVDIGLHYVAASSGSVWDTDGDGNPDYIEDFNGDGNSANDAASWTEYNSQNNLTSGLGVVFTPLK